jgi:hypothetical protein
VGKEQGIIERTIIDGRPATVCYCDDNMDPTSKAKATMLRVTWDDGSSAWLTRAAEEPPHQARR